MTAYCPACIDSWNIQESRLTRGDFVTIAPGTRLHVTCGRALEAIRTTPPAYDFGDDAETRWVA